MDGLPNKSRRTSISGINEGGPTGPPTLRRASATAAMPATRHVGFHVEGVPPSPAQVILAGAHYTANTAAGSPTPVIIPPSFQVRIASAWGISGSPPPVHASAPAAAVRVRPMADPNRQVQQMFAGRGIRWTCVQDHVPACDIRIHGGRGAAPSL